AQETQWSGSDLHGKGPEKTLRRCGTRCGSRIPVEMTTHEVLRIALTASAQLHRLRALATTYVHDIGAARGEGATGRRVDELRRAAFGRECAEDVATGIGYRFEQEFGVRVR